MARKFLVAIDLNKNELQNAQIQNLATAPSSPVAGQVYYNTTSNSIFFWNGSAWLDVIQSGTVISGLFSARPAAGTNNRLFYATDQQILYFDNGTTWAQVSNFGTVTAQTSYGASSGNGSSNNYARADHTHGTPSLTSNAPTTIAVGAAAAVGTGTTPARDDHTHGMAAFGAVTAQTSYGSASGNGSATTIARSDHTHGTPSLTAVTPTTLAIGGAAAVGTGTAPAREDHSHGMPAFGAVTAQTSFGAASTNGTGTSIARNDHTHGTPTHDNAAHSAINLSALAAPTANVSLGTFKITNLADPTANQDAATKNYVDTVAQGLNVHPSAKGATTANLTATYANGTAGVGATLTNSGTLAAFTVDGVTFAVSDRVLVKNQTTTAQNGIYVVTTLGSASVAWVLTRAVDFDAAGEIGGGDFVFIELGTVNNDTGWVCIDSVTTVGTDPIVFTQFSGAGTYLAGNGLSLAGNTFSFNPTGTGGLTASGGGASILKPANSGLVTDATGLYVGAGTGITVSGTNVSLTNSSLTVNGTAISLGGSGTITANTTNALTLGTGLTGTSFNGSAAVTAAIDTAVVVRKYATNVGDGTSTAITITHSLNTRDIQVTLYDNSSPYAEVNCDVEHTTTTTAILRFSVAPTLNQYRVVVFA